MTDSQWSSPSKAGSASATVNDVDPWLVSVMRNERNRAAVVSLEKLLREFVANSPKQQFVFPPKGRFYRKVCHAVALWYNLDHRLEQTPNAAADELQLILVKTPTTAVPAMKLADLVASTATVASGVDCHSSQPKTVVSDCAPTAYGAALATDWKAGVAAGAPSVIAVELKRDLEQSLNLRARTTSADDVANLREGADSQVDQENCRNIAVSSGTSESANDDTTSSEHWQRPAVLRRPMDSAARQGWRNSSLNCNLSTASSGATAVKNVTMEEYESVRARIFQKPASGADDADSVSRQILLGPSRVNQPVLAERYARGPVEGTIGFTRPRGRRSAGQFTGAPNMSVGTGERSQTPRLDHGNGDIQGPNRSNEQRLRGSSSEHEQADLHDPDFDRRYSKWVVQTALQPQLQQYYVPGNVFGQPMGLQPRNDAAPMHTPFQGQQQFQILHHPLTLQSGGGSVSLMSGAAYGAHGQLFPAHHLHHPGVLHDHVQQMPQSNPHQAVPQARMEPALPAAHLSSGLNPFPYSSMWLPHISTGNSQWGDPPQAAPLLTTDTVNAERQRRLAAGSADSLLHASPPAAYGLDSRVDFPSLSEAQSLAKQ